MQSLNEVHAHDVDATVARVAEMERALATALDDVETLSLSSADMLEDADAKVGAMREQLDASESNLAGLMQELSGARARVTDAAQATAIAQVRSYAGARMAVPLEQACSRGGMRRWSQRGVLSDAAVCALRRRRRRRRRSRGSCAQNSRRWRRTTRA